MNSVHVNKANEVERVPVELKLKKYEQYTCK